MIYIDLTQELYDGMPVYPGDPEVKINHVHTLGNEGWRLRTISLPSHIGMHVNVSSHMVEDGKSMDDVELALYAGRCRLYREGMEFSANEGVLFADVNIDVEITDAMIENPPAFVGLSADFDFDIPCEKRLLEHDIISYENLVHLEQLPTDTSFMFYGFPLPIRNGDGSPVRAVAVIDN